MPVLHLTAKPPAAARRRTMPTAWLVLTAWLSGCSQPPFAPPPPPEAVACTADCEELPPAELNIPWGP